MERLIINNPEDINAVEELLNDYDHDHSWDDNDILTVKTSSFSDVMSLLNENNIVVTPL